MKSYTYLIVNLACVIIPLAASFYPKHTFFNSWKFFFKANLAVGLVFIIWDYFFTKLGVWGFNQDYLTGFYLGNLPLEEILFFFCIPFACVFTYFSLTYLVTKNPFQKIHKLITLFLIAILLFIAVISFDKLYTSVTFFSTSLFLVYLLFIKVNLSYHYLSYLFILPFFLISNGILTGSFLVEPIVWYNNTENLNIKIVNIPIEDGVYGMLLIFLNIELFEFFKKRNKIKIKNHSI